MIVMAGLDPAIHRKEMDPRVKPGGDDIKCIVHQRNTK